MALKWCQKCKKKSKEKDEINLRCLGCKWEYVGQSAFERKEDLFIEDENDNENLTPYEYWKDFKEIMLVDEII